LPPVLTALLDLERHYNEGGDMSPGVPARFSLVIGKIAGGHYETVTAGEVVLAGGAYFSPELGDVVTIMEGFRRAIAEANARDPALRQHPARLEFLHHDDSMLQQPDIEIAREMGAVLARRGGEGTAHPGAFCCDARHL